MKTVRRELSTIANEIHVELKQDTAGIIKIGGLLAEAKKQIKHGEWLPWIEENFSMSQATAQRYLQVHKFLKTRTVRDLEAAKNLSTSALYNLAATKPHDDVYTQEAIQAIFNEAAEGKRVGAHRAQQIAWEEEDKAAAAAIAIEHDVEAEGGCPCPNCSCRTEVDADIEAEEAEAAAEQAEAEAEAILDGSPPDVPPPSPEPSTLPRDQFLLSSFAQGVKLLGNAMTNPASKFATGDVSAAHLESIADFLRQVAASINKAAA
jgi:Protein of unknown function (DUF3102)